MKTQKLLYVVGFLFVVIGAYIGIKNDIPASTKEADLESKFKAALLVGTDIKTVISYLDANKVEHGDFDKDNHQLIAMVGNVEKGMFVVTDVQITFHFDKDDKLQSLLLKELLTGL